MADKPLKSITFPGLTDKYTILEIDSTLTQQGEAADAKKTGDEISGVKNTLNHKADVIYDTASGDIASFPDGADGLPVKDLTVGIEPVQDLHGYENPWPAGGGKNKLPYPYSETTKTDNGVTFTDVGDGTIRTSGTATTRTIFYLNNVNMQLASGNYVLSKAYQNAYTIVHIDAYNGSTWAKILATSSSVDDVQFTVDYDGYDRITGYIEIMSGVITNGIVFKPMIRLATVTDATFAPYSNICPISGWTGANVTRTGKNLLDTSTTTVSGVTFTQGNDGYITQSPNNTDSRSFSYAQTQYKLKLPAGEYKFVIDVKTAFSGSSGAAWKLIKSNGDAVIPAGQTDLNTIGIKTANFTLSETTDFGVEIKQFDAVARYMIIKQTESTEYESYTGTLIPISWQSSAGTVYGGTLDVTSGVLTVTDANIASYNGETLPGEWISDRDVYAAGTTPTTGAQVVYKLAQPSVFQLNPVTVSTLLGQNNIFADCGPSTVEYGADTKLYIDKKLAALVAALS